MTNMGQCKEYLFRHLFMCAFCKKTYTIEMGTNRILQVHDWSILRVNLRAALGKLGMVP